MSKKGRPIKTRTSELGVFIEEKRQSLGWSISKLAEEAKISPKTLSKIELERTVPRHPEVLMRIARALDEHPDRLLVLAKLTPMLRPSIERVVSTPQKTEFRAMVTDDEKRRLTEYLQHLRYVASIEELCRNTRI